MPSTTLPKPTPSHPAPAPAPAPNPPNEDEAPFHTVDLELGLPHEKPQQSLPSYRDTQRDICSRRRAQHARSKKKQCRRARRQQIIITLIMLSIITGMSPLVVVALNQ